MSQRGCCPFVARECKVFQSALDIVRSREWVCKSAGPVPLGVSIDIRMCGDNTQVNGPGQRLPGFPQYFRTLH